MPESRGPRKPRKLATEELFEYAVKCLTARIYSTGDLSAKLRLRASHLPDVPGIMDRLKERGYVNDERFAESFASARVENDGFGRIRVLNDLRKHRIPGELADAAVEQALEGKNEANLIDAYIERRMPSVAAAGIDDERKLASAFRRLRRAGFTTGPVLTALKRLAVKPEVLDDFHDEPEEAED